MSIQPCLLTTKRQFVGADPNLTPADPILTRGWELTAKRPAVDKCRSLPGLSSSSLTQRCSRGEDAQAVGRSGFPGAALAQMSASGGGCLSARRACSRALMRFLATAVLCKNR